MTQQDKQEVLQIVQQWNKTNYGSGSPAIPPHTHNGIDNLRISASNILGLSNGVGGLNGYQIFTSGGTFTVPSGFTKFLVQIIGGGANGGSLSLGGTASGGNSGVYCESLVNLSGISSVSVTIGGVSSDSSFGTYVVTPGAGSATTIVGTFQLPSNGGFSGYSIGTTGISGQGASSIFGTGGVPATATTGTKSNGNPGIGYGSGGSGSVSFIGSSSTGGSGTGGVCIISW